MVRGQRIRDSNSLVFAVKKNRQRQQEERDISQG